MQFSLMSASAPTRATPTVVGLDVIATPLFAAARHHGLDVGFTRDIHADRLSLAPVLSYQVDGLLGARDEQCRRVCPTPTMSLPANLPPIWDDLPDGVETFMTNVSAR